ncbi:phage tail tube protein [Corticibacterium sp. UT-5YL-CI-8]|nr:phage tail tube protein [Tianweitania sp. UT-5YL-CI-8]
MAFADGSQVRLADVSEATIGTIPATPAFQVMRYRTASVRLSKQTDISDEVRPDRNVPGITDVGRSVTGTVETRFSYGTYDTWLERLLCSTWATDVLKNGTTHKTSALEFTFEQGATDSYVRYTGIRWNTLDLNLRSRQAVLASWGIMGIDSPTPTTAIVTGATYVPPTTTEDFNAGLNVANLAITSTTLVSSPKVQAMSLRITNNIYQVDVIGKYAPEGHGLGRFEASGSMTLLFENLAAYTAILNHETVAISFDLVDAEGNKYTFALPKVKFNDGGPAAPGNGQPVTLEVPFMAFYDATSGATLTVTRDAV